MTEDKPPERPIVVSTSIGTIESGGWRRLSKNPTELRLEWKLKKKRGPGPESKPAKRREERLAKSRALPPGLNNTERAERLSVSVRTVQRDRT